MALWRRIHGPREGKTMMVHVYQIMVRYSLDISYAAIPTFVIFVFCQNIIIRGIVVPTEK